MRECMGCEHERDAPHGICQRQVSKVDALPLRCVGDWSRDKFYYLRRYLEASQTAMREKWRIRNYVDLFSGPGKCIVRGSGQELEGSPLIALSIRYPFTAYHFVDASQECIGALAARCSHFAERTISFENSDCNVAVKDVAGRLERKALNIAMVDPTGLDVSMDTLACLSSGVGVDLIVNFPFFTAVKRNVRRFLLQDESKLDLWMGSSDWRTAFHDGLEKGWVHACREVARFYIKQLKQAGYTYADIGYVPPVKAGPTRLYYLVLASKSRLAIDIWKGVARTDSSGQRRLALDTE